MQKNYKRLGDYIREVDIRNEEGVIETLLGINIDKFFMPSVANVVGTDLTRYKVVDKNQFACNRMHVGRDKRLPVALSAKNDKFIVSPAYDVFEIIDKKEILPDYLIIWLSRKEFDRNTWFFTNADVPEGLSWNTFLDMRLPVPPPSKQREIVAEYKAVQNRIALNNQLIQKLESTAQTIYKQWFVDFEFPDENGNPYKSNGGEIVESELGEIPKGWEAGYLSDLANITMGQSPEGETYNTEGKGMTFYQGRTDFGYRFPDITTFTTAPNKKAKKCDILISVRAPVGDLNIAVENCCIGRGLAAIKSKANYQSFLFYLMQTLTEHFDVSNDEGTVFGAISKEALNGIRINKPQNSIIESFEKLIVPIDKIIELKSKQNKTLHILREVLLSEMAKGVIK